MTSLLKDERGHHSRSLLCLSMRENSRERHLLDPDGHTPIAIPIPRNIDFGSWSSNVEVGYGLESQRHAIALRGPDDRASALPDRSRAR
jgi:hypothetical protein